MRVNCVKLNKHICKRLQMNLKCLHKYSSKHRASNSLADKGSSKESQMHTSNQYGHLEDGVQNEHAVLFFYQHSQKTQDLEH